MLQVNYRVGRYSSSPREWGGTACSKPHQQQASAADTGAGGRGAKTSLTLLKPPLPTILFVLKFTICSRWSFLKVVVVVCQVVDIMRVNVDKVLERDQKLSELDDRADALQAGASQFESSAAKLKNKYWWKNCKVGMFLCGFWLALR